MKKQLDEFTQAYIEAALWTNNLDVKHGPKDIAPETLEIMITVCKRFQEENAEDIAAGDDGHDYTAIEHAGRDFWLTRNGYGAGFWDGDWEDEAGKRLTVASKAFKPMDLYVGDDKLIHSL